MVISYVIIELHLKRSRLVIYLEKVKVLLYCTFLLVLPLFGVLHILNIWLILGRHLNASKLPSALGLHCHYLFVNICLGYLPKMALRVSMFKLKSSSSFFRFYDQVERNKHFLDRCRDFFNQNFNILLRSSQLAFNIGGICSTKVCACFW